jgi:hypothetical protein
MVVIEVPALTAGGPYEIRRGDLTGKEERWHG